MTFFRRPITAVFLFACSMSAALPAHADEVRASLSDEAAALRNEFTRREMELRQLHNRLIDLEARIEQMENGRATPHAVDSRLPASTMVDSGDSENHDTTIDHTDQVSRRDQEQLLRSALERTLLKRGGLLLPAWSYSIEPSIGYVHSSAENVVVDGFTIFPVLVVGDIVSERVVRDLSLATFTLRLGLPWNTQAEVRIPYGHQKFRSYSADGTEVKMNDNALGDIEFGLSAQIYTSNGKWPDLEASFRYKTDSGNNPFTAQDGDIFVGSGFDSMNVLLTAVKVADPVVYFGGVDYTLNRSTSQDIGKYSPGDSWGFNIGMAIALNLQNSLSFAYDQHFTQRGRIDGEKIPGSYATTGVFSVGSTYAISDTATIDMSVGMGVTEDSPDLLFSLSMPINGSF